MTAFAAAALGPALGALGGPLRALAPLVARLRGDAAAPAGTASAPPPPPRASSSSLLARLTAPLRAALAFLGARIYAAGLRAVLRWLLSGARTVPCRLRSLSSLLAAERLDGADVALLKIDVERAELDVLRGVAASDWRRVRSVAMEVHDVGGRVAAVTALLRAQPAGFDRVTAVQPDRCVLCAHGVRVFAAGS